MRPARNFSRWTFFQAPGNRRRLLAVLGITVVLAIAAGSLPGYAQKASPSDKKPNILVIFGDDIGIWNISAYHRGMMGGRTPNIDRLAKEGAMFTDYYGQQSCTAGRAAFILGQTPFRTGLLKVGMPGARQGIQDKDPTIAELLKPLDMPRRRSARTTSGTATSTCRRCTASTSSTATSTISMPRRSRKIPTIPRARSSGRSSARGACSTARPRT